MVRCNVTTQYNPLLLRVLVQRKKGGAKYHLVASQSCQGFVPSMSLEGSLLASLRFPL